MNKKKFIPLLVFHKPKMCCFNDVIFSMTNNKQVIFKELQDTEKQIANSKNIFNSLLLTSIGICCITTMLLYYAIDNDYVIKKLEIKNLNTPIKEIKNHIKIGFSLNLLITGILVHISYKYNKSQEDLKEEISKIAIKNFLI